MLKFKVVSYEKLKIGIKYIILQQIKSNIHLIIKFILEYMEEFLKNIRMKLPVGVKHMLVI